MLYQERASAAAFSLTFGDGTTHPTEIVSSNSGLTETHFTIHSTLLYISDYTKQTQYIVQTLV